MNQKVFSLVFLDESIIYISFYGFLQGKVVFFCGCETWYGSQIVIKVYIYKYF